MPQMTIYVTEDQRKLMRSLAEKLDKQGVNVRDNRGNVSVSALIRHWAEQERDRQAEKGSNDESVG